MKLEFLKVQRKAHNLTQVELAEQAGTTQAVISKIEAGKRRPSVDAAKRIAAVLGFNWTAFFPEVPEIQPPKEG